MRSATDSAKRSPARWLWFGIGLAACCVQAGCARMQSFRDNRPVLGMVTDAGPKRPSGGDLYAERTRAGMARSQALLAEHHAPPSSESIAAPVNGVALRAPEPVGPTRADDPAPVLASNTAAVPPEPSVAPADAPGPSAESVVAEARSRLDSMTSYEVPLNRQERVGETLQETEDVVLSIRRDPKAVRLEWREGPHKGREVLYTDGGLMHVNMADSVVPVPRLALPIDSPMVLRSSRHPITEAGYDTIVANLEAAIERTRAGDPSRGRLTYDGLSDPGTLHRPCHKVVRTVPESGEVWQVYFDPESKLPALVQANAANGDLLERYTFGVPKADLPELASADAFDPEKRWGAPEGLLQRLARANSARASHPANPPQ